jgi:hypothetical protein
MKSRRITWRGDASSPASTGPDFCFLVLACLLLSGFVTSIPNCKDASPVAGVVGRACERSPSPVHCEQCNRGGSIVIPVRILVGIASSLGDGGGRFPDFQTVNTR